MVDVLREWHRLDSLILDPLQRIRLVSMCRVQWGVAIGWYDLDNIYILDRQWTPTASAESLVKAAIPDLVKQYVG